MNLHAVRHILNDPSTDISPTLRAQLLALLTPQQGGRPPHPHFSYDGIVTHIWCSLHKQWEPVYYNNAFLFPKATATKLGYKTMCKEAYTLYVQDLPIQPRTDRIGSTLVPLEEDMLEVIHDMKNKLYNQDPI